METYLIKLAIIVVLSIGLAWGGVKKDREWNLVKFNKFTTFMITFSSLLIFYITYSAFSAQNGPPIIVLVGLASLSVYAVFGINETFRAKAWYDEEKIYFNSPFGKKIIIKYSDIVSCNLSIFRYYVVVSKSGEKAKISKHMSGINEMVRVITQKTGVI